MAGKYRHPSYRQYMPAELLEELRAVSKATNTPMQQIVRAAVRKLLADLKAETGGADVVR